MIKAHDLYYLPRVENLKKEQEKCKERLKFLEDDFEHRLHFETISYPQLTVLQDQMQTVMDLMSALEDQIEVFKLEISN